MSEKSTTSQLIEACLSRLAAGDNTAWDELITHAFNRLLALCRTTVHKELAKPNPLITPNAVLAEAYKKLATAMKNPKVQPKNAEEFLGLAARNIRWQLLDMIRQLTPPPVDARFFDAHPDGRGISEVLEKREMAVKEQERWRLLNETLDTLPENEREIFDLHWTQGLSEYEIAERLGKTRNEVDGIWRKVKRKIGAVLKDYTPPKT